MAYATEEQRVSARKESRRRYHLKTYKYKGYPKYRPTYKEGRGTKEFSMWESTFHRAKRNGMEFSITLTDIVIPELCPVLGIPISITNNKTGGDSPSIDRFDNTKGYTPDNIRVISWRANKLKGDGTAEEFEKILDYMKG